LHNIEGGGNIDPPELDWGVHVWGDAKEANIPFEERGQNHFYSIVGKRADGQIRIQEKKSTVSASPGGKMAGELNLSL